MTPTAPQSLASALILSVRMLLPNNWATSTKSLLRIVQIMMTQMKVRTRSSKDWSKTASPPRSAVKRRRLSIIPCSLMLLISMRKTKFLRKRSTISPWCCTPKSRKTHTSSVNSIRHSSRTNLSWLKFCHQTRTAKLATHHKMILPLTIRQIIRVCLLPRWCNNRQHPLLTMVTLTSWACFRLSCLRSSSKKTRCLLVELSCQSPPHQTLQPSGPWL